jgi:ribosome assembly protein RRB1
VNLDEDPTIEHINVPHSGGVNRVRSLPQRPGLVASWADTGSVHLFDLTAAFQSMTNPSGGPRAAPPVKPLFSFAGHREEGFALDWSPVSSGRLVTGDCAGAIHLWQPMSNGVSWSVETSGGSSSSGSSPFLGHKKSVEDLQWSPTEGTVFASCSADKTIKIWDTRAKKAQISFEAHSDDVNVLSWNRNVGFLLGSGSDDGSFKVWDLRSVKPNTSSATSLANFSFHKGPITSLEWAPHDESMISVSSTDNQISVWDLSVEADNSSSNPESKELEESYPPQLLFLHMGQNNIKELHFHPQIPGTLVSTAEDSFNVFKPAITVSS